MKTTLLSFFLAFVMLTAGGFHGLFKMKPPQRVVAECVQYKLK